MSGFKHDNRLKCHRGIVSQWTFQVGLNVTVDETWVDVTSRHPAEYVDISRRKKESDMGMTIKGCNIKMIAIKL